MNHQQKPWRIVVILGSLWAAVLSIPTRGAEPATPVRGVLVRAQRVTPEFLNEWKAKGARSVVVVLDESVKKEWPPLARMVAARGMDLWAWVEVARNPAMADAHPEWVASLGGHHDDWRKRFPDAPRGRSGEGIKAWPWVPIGYTAAYHAHRARIESLLANLPGSWSGVFLNDLQTGPSSCGCGNDQCRWALDYGTPATAAKSPGDDAAARLVGDIRKANPGKAVVPVWVEECEPIDLPGAPGGTGLCGGVGCARGDCWPRNARAWNPLHAAGGPIALGVWSETFKRDPDRWIDSNIKLFQNQPAGAAALEPDRTIAVVEAWGLGDRALAARLATVARFAPGWLLALDPIEQSWKPILMPAKGK